MWGRFKKWFKAASWRRKLLVVASAFGAVVLTATVGAAISTERVDAAGVWAWKLITGPFDDDPKYVQRKPTDRELILDIYEEQTREAGIWVDDPLVYQEGLGYLDSHFADFDPRRVHQPRGFVPERKRLTPHQVVDSLPYLVGRRVTVIGAVRANQSLQLLSGRLDERLIQLSEDSPEASPLVYCRVTATQRFGSPVRGTRAVAQGVILAAGTVHTDDGGTQPAAYMACSWVALYRPELPRPLP